MGQNAVKEERKSAIKFPGDYSGNVTITPEQLEEIVQSALATALSRAADTAPKKKSHKRMKTTSLYKSNGVKKASEVDPIRTVEDYKKMRDVFLNSGDKRYRVRNYVLFVLGCSVGLRIGDLLTFTTDLVFEKDGSVVNSIELIEEKTGKRNEIYIPDPAKEALKMWKDSYGFDPAKPKHLFFSKKTGCAMGIENAWRIINNAAAAAGLIGNFGTHTMRKTYGWFAYTTASDVGLGDRAVELLQMKFNHDSPVVTKKYIKATEQMIAKMSEAASEKMNQKEE